jgi:hypothetical protein
VGCCVSPRGYVTGVLAERATLLGPLSSRSLLDLHPLEGWRWSGLPD